MRGLHVEFDSQGALSLRESSVVDEIAQIVEWVEEFSPGMDWGTVEAELGTRLPADYKELFSRFPSGVFRSNIRIMNPASNRKGLTRFKKDNEELMEILSDEDLPYLEDSSYVLFPESGGLLPWADDLQGDIICWITEGEDPDAWKIARYSQGRNKWIEYSESVAGAILGILKSDGVDNILGRDPAAPVGFHPMYPS